MNNTKYVIGLAGLVVGFLVSFFWVSSYNRNNAPAAPTTAGATAGGMPAASGSGNEQATMGQVQQIIEKAKNNPKDFDAQVDAAAAFEAIKQTPGIVEYLGRAYEANPQAFVKRDDLKSLLPNIALYYSQQKKYDKADLWIQRAKESAPNDSEMQVEFGSAYLRRESPQPDKAIQELQAALKANPKNAHALGHLTEAYALKNNVAGAEDALNRMREAEPSNERLPALQNMVADLKAGKPVTLPKE